MVKRKIRFLRQIFREIKENYLNSQKKKVGLVSNANTHMEIANKIRHSFLEICQSFLINKTIIHIVMNNSRNEKDVSWNKCRIHSQFQDGSRHWGVSSMGRITALTQMIPSVLNIFDHIRFATHISYFFLTIAVIVVANSGKLVHAAMIVAQIAHSDIHKVWAINTVASTITSDAITSSPILATSFVMFKSIHFEVSFAIGILLLKSIINRSMNNNITNISLTQSIPKVILNAQDEVSILIKASNATPRNR